MAKSSGDSAYRANQHPAEEGYARAIGRRTFFGVLGLGTLIALAGTPVENLVSSAANSIGSPVGGFQIYTVTGSIPEIPTASYKLKLTGLVERQVEMDYSNLMTLPQRTLVETFTCVTGWSVPGTRWTGVDLLDLLETARLDKRASEVQFLSDDGVYTDTLTLGEIRELRPLIASHLDGSPLSAPHGGPIRLIVPKMYGYKSVKWLGEIRVGERFPLGFWEQRGYPANALIQKGI
jgi:DMSO/TMAO reductase YedYZ molybdopterin-dependent catalytic subunit